MRRAFGTYEIARFCEVSPATVGRWIKGGKLPFFRTGGGQRRVWAQDLKAFLEGLNMPVPPGVVANGHRRVLVVDDDPLFRRAVIKTLAAEFPEAEVHAASDGFEGGVKVAQLLPSLVLLDLKLPGQDGLKVCRLIRSDAALRGVRVVCVSGDSSAESRRRALDAGADEFLGKPFDAAALRGVMKRFVA